MDKIEKFVLRYVVRSTRCHYFKPLLLSTGFPPCSLPPAPCLLLTDQIRRSSRSVCANLAEAWRKRRYEAAFIAKLNDSEAEAAETQTWLKFAVKCNYLDVETGRELYGTYNRALGILVTIINNPSPWLIKR